jgi:multidrug resistance efflux pump
LSPETYEVLRAELARLKEAIAEKDRMTEEHRANMEQAHAHTEQLLKKLARQEALAKELEALHALSVGVDREASSVGGFRPLAKATREVIDKKVDDIVNAYDNEFRGDES